MRQFCLLHLSMIMSCCALLARGAQAQASPADIRRLPNAASDGQALVPREVPIQIPRPCADTTIIYVAADTLRGVQVPILVRFPHASLAPGEWHADFLIDTSGAPDRESIAATRNGKPSRDGRFLAMIEALRFQPASLSGCAVRFKSGMDVHTEG